MTARSLTTFVVALALMAACQDKPADVPKVSFEPGPMVEQQLAQLGGVTLKLPDNLKVTETPDAATLEGEGFPTVSIARQDGEFGGTGISRSSGMGKIDVRYTIPSSEWTCSATDAGEHEDLVVEICESLTAPKQPNVSKMECASVEGFDAAAVRAAWAALAEPFTTCFTSLDEVGVSFGFNLSLEAGSRSFTKFVSPMSNNPIVDTCVADIYAKLESTAALANEAVETGKVECSGSYSVY